jgi:hypothetical protein
MLFGPALHSTVTGKPHQATETLGRCSHHSLPQVCTPIQTGAVKEHPASVVGRNLQKFREEKKCLEMVSLWRTLISKISPNNRIILEFEIRDKTTLVAS